MAATLLLDRSAWDLVVDAAGNIAVCDEPYALAQDAASALRLFKGELWYDTAKGVPYFQQILGKAPPLSLLKASFNAAALTVPGVTFARSFIADARDRVVTGQVQLTTKAGAVFGLNETLFGRRPAGAVIPALSPPVGPMPAPATATLTRISADGAPVIAFVLEWDAVDDRGLGSYHVQFSLDAGRSWTVDGSTDAPGTQFILAGAVPLHTYEGRVQAISSTGTRSSVWTYSNQSYSGGSLAELVNTEGLTIVDPDGLPVLVRT